MAIAEVAPANEAASANDPLVEGMAKVAVEAPAPTPKPRSDVVRDWSHECDAEFAAEAQAILAAEKKVVPPFWVQKYEKEATKKWNEFYKRNKANFYKDRHYLQNEFADLQDGNIVDELGDSQNALLVELGCGVGNACLPLLEAQPKLRVLATDCAPEAIALLDSRREEMQLGERCRTAVVDITTEEFPEAFEENSADFVLLLFVLSAISPEKQANVVAHIKKILKPGGKLLFRDYGRYDLAQLRFASAKGDPSKLAEHFYVRNDGTRAYYFSMEDLRALFAEFEECELKNCCRVVTNRKEKKDMKRIWVQGQWKKPAA